jgi:gliding motility-associated lipoprotein GldD
MLFVVSLLTAMFVTSCEEDAFVPKPRAFPRVIYPERAYKPFDANYCKFTFEQPVYATVQQDSTFFDKKAANECWFNLDVASLNAQIHCSYAPLDRANNRLDKLVNDSYVMAQKHNIKADYIAEAAINRPSERVYGMVFEIDGATASSYQFYLTDSTNHFLRGALYFKNQTRPDSMAPVIRFMKEDVNKMIETLKWAYK